MNAQRSKRSRARQPATGGEVEKLDQSRMTLEPPVCTKAPPVSEIIADVTLTNKTGCLPATSAASRTPVPETREGGGRFSRTFARALVWLARSSRVRPDFVPRTAEKRREGTETADQCVCWSQAGLQHQRRLPG